MRFFTARVESAGRSCGLAMEAEGVGLAEVVAFISISHFAGVVSNLP